jgi:amino acid adenylation domain-containing protein
LRLNDQEHVLLLTMHHIASDGWSLEVFWRELGTLYKAYCGGAGEAGLADLPVQYADYAVWQSKVLEGQRLETLLEYWRNQLNGVTALELPIDHSRPARPSYRGASYDFELGSELVSQLKLLGQSEGVTLHMTLLAAFQTLLSRYSGQDDIAVGVPVAGRNQTELEDLIGFFVNTLVLRTDLSGDPTFRELLGRVREVSLSAYDHQDLPFEKLVEELRPERQLNRSPLFQVMFQLLNFSDKGLELRNLDVSRLPSGSQRVRFDLEMHLWQQDKTLRGSVVYSTDLFDHSTIERMVGHFITLLQGIVAAPDHRISQLPLLTESERHQLLVEWNDTAADYRRDKCVHQLFEEQVEKTPDAVAVVFEDQQLSYRELNERANQLAHHLIALGVGPETLVGLCLERSPELVVGILGILKAGGAYVPLDVELPAKRLEFMLQDSKLQFIVTQQGLRDLLPVSDWQAVYIELEYARIEVAARSNPASGVRVENLAYVMFTSGSTGTPKGVAIEHRSASNLLLSMCQFLPEKSLQKFLGVASPTFDISVAELFSPLIIGGATLLPSRRDSKDPQLLAAIIDQLRPSVIQATPATWSALIENGWNADTEKALISTGEALPKALGRQLLKLGRLFDLYGPTETTIWSCQHHLQAAEQIGSIGTPISNTQVYVLDEHRQPLPIGVPGELYIGGAGLARGYLNRSELTAEKFVANPFSENAESRLYRTSDLCRWRADGNLEFLGRMDNQVKLRGFRIELGEIESVLNEHPNVSQSIVILREDRPGDKRLVAYCVPAKEGPLNRSDLTKHLHAKLPEYMVPSAFVFLDVIPLTSSGKVNRRGLPAPDYSRLDLETHYVAPGTPIEEQLASIWAEVLGIDEIGIHDNFFALGGHSLLATRVIARISSALQVDLPLRKLFEAPTIDELANEIETLRSGGLIANSTALVPVDRDQFDRLPLSYAQQRLWFLEEMEGELTAYNMPYAWRLTGALNTEALRLALEEVVRRHEPLRTTFSVVDGEPVQVIRKMERWELPLEDLGEQATDQQTSEVMRRFQVEAERPFDLSGDLMLRTSLLRLNDQEHVLLLTMHHIASDGWSLEVFWRELGTLYKAYCGGAGEAGLADLPVQYADYAVWQSKVLAGQRLETLLEYWRNQLNGVTALELPIDHSRPARPSYRGASYDFELGSELVSQLKLLGQSEGVTLHMTLLAAFQTLLSRYSGQDDIAVGVPVAGRNQTELEDLIGFFVNTLVLRTDLSGDPTFRELLGRVREVSLSAYDHQDLPFEKLVEELRPERQLNRSPLFQVLFQLLNFSDEELALRNLDVSRLPSGSQRVRFDLEMHLWQQDKTLCGSVVYSTDLFDVSTIERMVGHFITLLEGLVAAPDQRISELPLLTEAERHQLLVEWNDTAVEYPRDKCVHELFEEQVERTPDAVAVVFEEQQLSYRELNERANQLAHHLIALGVGPETLVGLCLNRSLEMVVGILGILKAGGAYVPIEADSPRSRLELILADARIEVLVTRESLRNLLPAADWRVVCLDTDAAKLREIASTNPLVKIAADNLAYVIYTSGSTGIPKGVAIRHRSITRLVLANDYAKFGPDRVFLQLAPVSFDASTFELWGSLLHGAKLVLAPPGLPDFHHLEAILKRNRVTTLWLTATLFNQIVEHSPQTLSSVQEILTGGEALSVRHIVRAQTFFGSGVHLINGYGPTESTTFTTCYRISSQIDSKLASIPIGRPIANTQVYVLDEHRQPLPIGVPGELYIGGAGLARGYLNRPELTAEKFVANPFSEDADSRLYRTGDLCCWRSDGNLEFIGRIDDQVKLRGYRIELGEIEAAMNEHPSVAQCVVALREDRPGDKRLVAYCVAASDSELHFSELRSHLQQRLPDYMLPAAFVRLDTLPLTSSGKVNRRGLPAPDDSRPELENGYVVPRNPLEEQLTQIWCDVLSIDKVGIHDNFFALGGHSLLVARMVGLIDRHCRMQISLALVFRNPTIAELARCLDSDVNKESKVLEYESMFLSVLRKGKGTGTLVCLGVISGPLMVQLPQHFGVLKLDLEQYLSIEQLTDVFATEVQRVVKSGPIILVGFSYGGLVAFALASRLRRRFGQTVELVMIEPSPPARKCDLVHTGAKTRTQYYLVRHLENLRAVGIKGWLPYIMEKVSFNVRYRLLAHCERRVIGLRIKLNLPLTPGQKWRYNLPKLVRNIRNYSIENLQGNAHLLGSAEYLQKHEDFWRTAVEGECRTKLLKNSSHHNDILVPAKSDEWINFLAELARSAKQ